MASGSAEAVEVLHSANCWTGKRWDRVGPRKFGAAEQTEAIEARRTSFWNMPVEEPAAVRSSSTPGGFISQEPLTFHKEQTKPCPAMRLPAIECSGHPQQSIGVDRTCEGRGSDTVGSFTWSTWSAGYGCHIRVVVTTRSPGWPMFAKERERRFTRGRSRRRKPESHAARQPRSVPVFNAPLIRHFQSAWWLQSEFFRVGSSPPLMEGDQIHCGVGSGVELEARAHVYLLWAPPSRYWWRMVVSNSVTFNATFNRGARPRDKSLNEQRTCCVSCSDMVLIERQYGYRFSPIHI